MPEQQSGAQHKNVSSGEPLGHRQAGNLFDGLFRSDIVQLSCQARGQGCSVTTDSWLSVGQFDETGARSSASG